MGININKALLSYKRLDPQDDKVQIFVDNDVF